MKFSEEVIEVLDYLGEKFGIAIDWTSESVMPYLQDLGSRIVNYEIATSMFWILIGIIPFVIAIVLFVQAYKKKDFSLDCYIGPGVFFMFIALLLIGIQTFDILKAKFIPEMTIYNIIKNLV